MLAASVTIMPIKGRSICSNNSYCYNNDTTIKVYMQC